MPRPTLKLRTRIVVYLLVLGLTWTVFVLFLLSDLLTATSRELIRDRGAQVARMLVIEAAPLARFHNESELTDLITTRADSLSDVRYVVVMSDDGAVLASTFGTEVPRSLLSVRHGEAAGPDVKLALIEREGEQLYDYEAAGDGVRVRLGMSLLTVERFAFHVTSYVLWTGVVALLGVFGIALHVSRPIEALMAAVARAAELDPDALGPAIVHGTAETSALASWFQLMVKRLQESAARLEKSKKLAYLGEIATSVAHEINNPLGVVVLNAEFLAKRAQKGELVPPVSDEVERVRAAAMRATLAAQKLLQFARYSTKEQGLQRRPVRPEPIVRETIELLSDEIRVAGCTTRVDVPSDLPPVSLDAQGIQQVLFNLITNALAASPSGSQIVVSARVESDQFTLSVIDSGHGMSEELLAHAKEPFVTTKGGGTGTGLGLAISDSIVRRHGGELVLESRHGEGTQATVRVPIGSPR